jgi:hypothetical protein
MQYQESASGSVRQDERPSNAHCEDSVDERMLMLMVANKEEAWKSILASALGKGCKRLYPELELGTSLGLGARNWQQQCCELSYCAAPKDICAQSILGALCIGSCGADMRCQVGA